MAPRFITFSDTLIGPLSIEKHSTACRKHYGEVSASTAGYEATTLSVRQRLKTPTLGTLDEHVPREIGLDDEGTVA